MPTFMETGDIWRKDTTSIHSANEVRHWLIIEVKERTDGFMGYMVRHLCLETSRVDDILVNTMDLTGNPYWKKVA